MGRTLLVANMETSPIFLFGILILLTGSTAALKKDSDDIDKKCDPKKDQCSDKNFQYCQDHDGNGRWTCACEPGYSRDMDGHCVLSACDMSFGDHPNGEYRTVEGKCYYYQKSGMEYADAVTNCKAKFNGNGRLFEPRSKSDNNDVVSQARQINANQPFWIGIRVQPHDESRDFYYLSEGPNEKLAFEGWAAGEPNDIGNKEDCVSVLRFSGNLMWDDSNCANEEYSICEQDVKRDVDHLSGPMTISVMMKTINLAAIMMVEHAVTTRLIYGTSFAKIANAKSHWNVCLKNVLMMNLKKLARRNAKEINVRKVNGARPIARKLVTTVQNGNQSYF